MTTIWAMSDLHADFPENQAWIEGLEAARYDQDALLVAGDVSHDLAVLEHALGTLRRTFARVFFVPGNHDLWLRKEPEEQPDSLAKLRQLDELCRRLGVETTPARVGAVWVVPLLSWYDEAFALAAAQVAGDAEVDRSQLGLWADFRHCRWPFPQAEVASYMRRLNEPHVHAYDAAVVSFSHFLPRPELVPPQRHLRFKALPLVSGDPALDAQVRAVGSRVHVYGHTHINRDVTLDGVRYVQSALRYPRERQGAEAHPVKVLEGA